mgnify:CR=1 FL=1
MSAYQHAAPAPVGGRMLNAVTLSCGVLVAVMLAVLAVRFMFGLGSVTALNDGGSPRTLTVTVTREDGSQTSFDAVLRIDTPGEADYYRNGGILQYVLRQLAG